MRNAPLLSDLELVILGFLRQRPRSGYDIRKALSSASVSDSPGTVYPALQRLRKSGLITATADTSTRRSKETFHVTTAGLRALRDSLSSPLTPDNVARDPDGVMMRLPFVQAELGRDGAARFLSDFARIAAARAAQLKRLPEIASAYEATMYTARSRWAAKTARSLPRRSKRPG